MLWDWNLAVKSKYIYTEFIMCYEKRRKGDRNAPHTFSFRTTIVQK